MIAPTQLNDIDQMEIQNVKVVCDTNIWYNLGTREFSPPNNVQLIGTWSNVVELAYSHPKNKVTFDLARWRQAANAILEYSADILELDPFEFATARLFPDSFDFVSRDLRSILKVISQSESPLMDSVYSSHQGYFDSFLATKNEFVSKMLTFKNGVRRELLKSKFLKDSFMKNQKEYHKTRAADILFDVDAFINQSGKTIVFDNRDDIEKSLAAVQDDFEFYIATKQGFLHNWTLMKSMSVQPNDFIDLTNLMYVDDKTSYWTLENRWLALIREAGQENKLYQMS